jgi:hypothetical protein
MNANHDVELRIADFYATEAPQRAPDWVLASALSTIAATPQRRRVLGLSLGWWTPPMPYRLALVAVIGVLMIGGAFYFGSLGQPAVGGPTPAPSASSSAAASPSAAVTPSGPASPSALPQQFTSSRYGYSFARPVDWQVEGSTRAWAYGEVVAPDLESLDRFLGPPSVPAGPTGIVGVASQPIAPDKTPNAWLDGYKARFQHANGACRPNSASDWQAFTVAGVTGWTLHFSCDQIALVDFIAVRDGRGWVITGDRALVEQFFSSFRFSK